MMDEVIVPKVQIPGIAWQRILDGDYINEEPERWKRLVAASYQRKYGARGFAQIVECARADDLADLFEYVHGVAEAMWSALGDQHGDPEGYASVYKEANACQQASDRIKKALADVGVEAKDRFDR
jgi:hypothetical protein